MCQPESSTQALVSELLRCERQFLDRGKSRLLDHRPAGRLPAPVATTVPGEFESSSTTASPVASSWSAEAWPQRVAEGPSSDVLPQP